MGEAIARFRDLALSIRRVCDERHSQPRGRAVKPAAAKKFAKQCREIFLSHEKAGMPYPRRYVHGLCKRRNEAERHPDPPPPGHFDLPDYIEWLPPPFAGKEPGDSEIRRARRDAVKEAVRWGSLFPVVEARIKALDAAADMLFQYAAAAYYSGGDKSAERDDENYIGRHEEFAEALDALAPFIEEPPPEAATSEKKTSTANEKKRRDRKGIGGRPGKFSLKFIREVVAARERDEKQFAKAKRPLPSKSEWLSDYLTEVKKLPLSILPSKDPKTPEEWSIRANRFWKAAKQRLSRSGN